MPEKHEHGSGVVPAGAYAPGSRQMNPAGLSQGITALPPESYPTAPPERRADKQRREREAEAFHNPPPPRRRGRPVGSKTRKPPTEDMYRAPPNQG
jgi:hypothetical protein